MWPLLKGTHHSHTSLCIPSGMHRGGRPPTLVPNTTGAPKWRCSRSVLILTHHGKEWTGPHACVLCYYYYAAVRGCYICMLSSHYDILSPIEAKRKFWLWQPSRKQHNLTQHSNAQGFIINKTVILSLEGPKTIEIKTSRASDIYKYHSAAATPWDDLDQVQAQNAKEPHIYNIRYLT